MRKTICLVVALILAATIGATAQNYFLVDSERVYKSINDYAKGLEELDKLGKEYQLEIDEKFEILEQKFQQYIELKSVLTLTIQKETEAKILLEEKEIMEYQKKIFGEQGTLIKKRMELMEPIKNRVDDILKKYAEENGFLMALDLSSNSSILYYVSTLDRTEQIIERLK